jgi:pimeloyl-ACP methyl ester carboxylesterase
VLLLLAAGAAPIVLRGQPAPLRYDLQPGDHLVYRERLDRRVTGEDSQNHVVAEWTTHILATGTCPGCVVTGFQRNRTSARLLRSEENGRNTTEADQKGFAEQLLTRPVATAEANWIDATGTGFLPWTVTREWRSLLLPAVREIEPLPGGAVAPGDTWAGRSLLGYKMSASACPAPDGADCLLLEGKAGAARLRGWFSRSQGVLTRLTITGEYDSPGRFRSREDISFELVERRRRERPDDWLSSPDTRAGTLAALHVSSPGGVAAARLYSLLSDGDAETDRQVLAVAWQWRLPPPPPAALDRLLGSQSPRVRVLAAHLAGRSTEDAATEKASGAVAPSGRATACAPAIARWSGARRFGREQPGASLRAMTTPEFAGWPYVLRVPDDYTGEHAVPMLVYLSGGPGLAVSGAQAAESALAATGYLALYPQADGLWWDERPRQVVRALIDEVVRSFNVDTDRVHLAGYSNGGTGSLVYAARWPDRFAAAAPTMAAAVGGGSIPLFVSGLNTLPLLLQHGTADRVIPVDQAAENRRQLSRQARTAPFDIVLLDGRDHDVGISTDDGKTTAFLAGRRRDSFPRAFVFETTDLESPRRYWIEIADKENGTARVEAQLAPDGGFDLVTKNVGHLRLLLRAEVLPRDGPVTVRVNGREVFREAVTEDCALFARTLQELSDPGRAYSVVVDVPATGQTVKSRKMARSMPSPIASRASASSSR